MMDAVEEILDCLNSVETRCTYGAVAGIIGGSAQGVGKKLGHRRPEASWVVNAKTGKPTGYSKSEMHPSLFDNDEIISTTDELKKRMRKWNKKREAGN